MGLNMSKLKVEPISYFEMMDRTSVILSNVDNFLVQHPAAKANKSISKKLDKVGELLDEVYYEAGAIYFELTEPENKKDE